MSKELIRLSDCFMKFDDDVILDHINLYINDKEFLTLLGPSGCGKTTTLRIIGGFQKPTSGDVFFDGVRINDVPPHKRKVNTVFQKYALFTHMNIFENVAFGLRISKVPEAELRERVEEALALVNLAGYGKRSVNSLSGGQQQRVAIARALVKMPRVLLLDEPLSNLDARLRLQTREEIRKIQRATGITTVFVTHDQEEAMSISDRIVVMKEGVVQQTGKPQEVYDSPANLFVAKFLGTPPINVFGGKVKDGMLYLGEDAVLDASGVADQEVTVGIRPEGFVPDEDGPMHCGLSRVEVMGRDVSIVAVHPALESESGILRAIISAEAMTEPGASSVRFSLKPNKVFLFDRAAGERIFFGDGQAKEGVEHES